MSNLLLYAGVGSACEIGGKDCGWLGLGPVAVLPSHQRRGIGQALVNEGLKTIRNLGAQGCFLVGPPAFYQRFGFQHHLAFAVSQ